ncbi:MAG: hypothetical protein ACTHP8_23770, partial [Bosea sp. (in: a-proteobacteria)]|uniref:hypothetical protein n=1 Tax=Bosea sp. (in: a-proteobacteria) TaxID=1871050 RepID=UPI003F7CA36F
SGLVRTWWSYRRTHIALHTRAEMMSPIEQHLEKARRAAAGYAPAPEASAITYGMIGMALFSVGMWGAGRFYDMPLIPHLSSVVVGSLIAFPVGIWLRKKRKGRHLNAYQAELARLGGERRS